jgi:hypothetical protein
MAVLAWTGSMLSFRLTVTGRLAKCVPSNMPSRRLIGGCTVDRLSGRRGWKVVSVGLSASVRKHREYQGRVGGERGNTG